jgi:hypothetical protein
VSISKSTQGPEHFERAEARAGREHVSSENRPKYTPA